jgi:hypothetical protein
MAQGYSNTMPEFHYWTVPFSISRVLDGAIHPFRIARPHHPVLRDPRSDRQSAFLLQALIQSPTAPAFAAELTPLLFDRNQPLCTNGGAPSGTVNG